MLVVGATVALLLATVLLLAWELLPAGRSPSAANERSTQSAATNRARIASEGTVKSTSSNNAPPPAHGSAAPASTGDFSHSASQHSAGPDSGLPGEAAAPSTATGPVPGAGDFGLAPARESSAPEAYLANAANPANPATQQRAVSDLLAQVQQAVVLITATSPAGTSQGSGFLVEGGNLVVTNYHVVEDATAVQVRLHDGRTAPVDRYATDAARDLVVLQLSLPDLPTGLPLRAELPKAGETVYAVGSPLGLEGSVTQGIVSAVRTCAQIEASLGGRLEYAPESRWVQTTAAVSGGNSGGPLVDTEGRALGVVTMGLRAGQNLNFALAAADVAEAMQAPKFVAVSPGNAPPIRSPVPPGQPVAANLPQPPGRSFPPNSSGLPAFPTVSLPGGQMLQATMLQVPKDLKSWISSTKAVYRVQGPGDAVLVAAGFNDARLHGRAAWFYPDNGRLAVLGHYDNAKRDGDFVFYSPNGSPIWLAQYKANSRHGLVAWFSGGFPVWIELWDLGTRKGEYFVSCHQAAAEVKNPDDVSDQGAIDPIRDTINQVAEMVQVWEDDEAQLRRDLAEWFRETDYAIKRHRATIRNVQARQAMLERIEARSSARTIGTMRSFAERVRAAGW